MDLSGGAASAAMAFRVIERFGSEETVVRFADVKAEHADVYRFIDDVEKVLGVEVVRLVDGRTKWDVFHEKAMMTAPKESGGGCLASFWLKKEILRWHAEQIADPTEATIYVGFGPDEDDRMNRIKKMMRCGSMISRCVGRRECGSVM